jgi:Cu2+-containing amine oxidase
MARAKQGAKKPAPTKTTRVAAAKTAKSAAKAKVARPAKASASQAKAAKPKKAASARVEQDVVQADPTLFAPLTHGERADAIRVLTEDKRVAEMAKVGRYRVISVEPLTVKPPQPLAGKRLARVVVYDYASDRCVDACVDLDTATVPHLRLTRSQPMLSRDEEAVAISIAMVDERVAAQLSLGDEPRVAMHYWSSKDTDLAFSRRSAAVIFGRPGARPSVVAVVDLIDNQVAEVVPAAQW